MTTNGNQGQMPRKGTPWWATAGVAVVLLGGCVGSVLYYLEFRANTKKIAFTTEVFSTVRPIREFVEKTGKMPSTLKELGIDPYVEVNWDIHDNPEKPARLSRELTLDADSLLVRFKGVSDQGPVTLILRPVKGADGRVSWDCFGGTLEKKYRLSRCKKE